MKKVMTAVFVLFALFAASGNLSRAVSAAQVPHRSPGYSDWATGADYQKLFDAMVQQNRYPRVVEARVFNGVVLYHAAFEPYPAGCPGDACTFSFWSHHGITPDVFAQKNDQYRRDGFRLGHKQSVYLGGREFIQGTWVSTAQAQAVSPAQRAMEECKRQYGGGIARGFIRDQWSYIEACFKEKTGVYPGQANVNCMRHYRDVGNFYC